MKIGKKLGGRALTKFEAERDIWQEVLDGVREIKAGGGRQSVVEPRSPLFGLEAEDISCERALR